MDGPWAAPGARGRDPLPRSWMQPGSERRRSRPPGHRAVIRLRPRDHFADVSKILPRLSTGYLKLMISPLVVLNA